MIEKLSCNSCGGPLEVPEGTRYLNCNHCGQSLAVKHSETATFTEAMEQLTEVAEDVAEDVASLKINQEIYELDRSWESQQDHFKNSIMGGDEADASVAKAIFNGVACVLVILFSLVMLLRTGLFSAGGAVSLFFASTGCAWLAAALSTLKTANSYQSSKRGYELKRQRLREQTD